MTVGKTVLLGVIITYIDYYYYISHKNVHNFYARQEVMQCSADNNGGLCSIFQGSKLGECDAIHYVSGSTV